MNAKTPSMPMSLETPTTKGNVIAQFVEAVHETSLELAAWRRFGQDVTAFLKDRDLTEPFGEFQADRQRERESQSAEQRAARATNARRRSRRS